jgi:hypothetical protein
MKAILEFSLPDETAEHRNALNGSKYILAAQEFDTLLRNKNKYEDIESLTIEEVRKVLRDCFDAVGIYNMDEE